MCWPVTRSGSGGNGGQEDPDMAEWVAEHRLPGTVGHVGRRR